ncbi:MAG TPA: DUF1598 domain-containing protein [Lacipirellulaceae bacterium]|jgi:hypothetical protein
MIRRRFVLTYKSLLRHCIALAVAFALGLALSQPAAFAQTGGGGTGSTIGNGATSGVSVDAEGVLSRTIVQDPTGDLARQRVQEALGRLDQSVAKSSPLRKVSLTRLERILAKRIAEGQGVDDVMKNLAGLTRVEYVFCYPETGDVVLAGPAEAWAQAPSGRMQGIVTGRPVIELADAIVALRAFPAGGSPKKGPIIKCSIDPTQEGLARMQEFLNEFGRLLASPNQDRYIVDQLRERLGMQDISVGGVPAKTHFAQVLVEADYRMKLIGIGLEQPPVRLKNYVDRANPAAISRQALERWYFIPDYECVRVSEDALAMQLVGEGVRLVTEGEMVDASGHRGNGRQNPASQQFVDAFTKAYPALAEKSPIFAQLRNCIDLAVAAAFIQQQDYYQLAKWTPTVFASEEKYAVETLNPPKQVESSVTAVWKGNTLVTPVSGGVEIKASEALSPTNLLEDKKEAVEKARSAVDLSRLSADQWWWD